jgi:LuxR family transcriptional regulator, maltose regulon positive regulatory protein
VNIVIGVHRSQLVDGGIVTTTVSAPAVSLRRRDIALLEDKLRVPRPGLAVLPRNRIRGLIDAATSRQVTLMTGPPGAGKTVAAAQWAAARPANRRAAWVTLDEADAEPGRFWPYVAAALSRAGATTSGKAASPSDIGPADIPHWISAALRTGGEPMVLILDDVHVLPDGDVLAGLDELIKHEPAGLRLLLAGRCAPALALAKLRVAGELTDIGAAELACTSEEIAAYFAMLDMRLGPAERADVLRHTEGWLAGLRLTALGTQAGEAGAQAMAADYLQDEVLSELPPQVRHFMLRTCLTGSVPADLARDLTGDTGAARLLEQLSREVGLVEAVLPDAGEYRYHPMLRAVLTADLRRELPDEVPVLQRRVARWHASRGEVLEAVEAAVGVGDWEFGRQVLRDAGPAVMLSAAGPGLEAALGDMQAEHMVGDEMRAVGIAAARLWQGDADGAVPHLEHAEAGLSRLAVEEREHLRLWLAALRVLYKSTVARAEPGWLDTEWSLASRAHQRLRGGRAHQALGVLWLALGFAALREFESQQARSALLHAGSQLSAGGLLALRERARSWEAVAAALYGDLAAATRLAATVADGPHGRDGDLIPVLALARAAVSLARDEPDAAGSQLDAADLAAMAPRPAGEPSIAVVSGRMRTRLAIAEGNLAGARGLVRWLTEAAAGAVVAGTVGTGTVGTGTVGTDTMAAGASDARWSGALTLIAVLDAEISLAGGERDRARATLASVTGVLAGQAETGQAETGRPGTEPVRPEVAVCQARLLIADEDDKGALIMVEPLLADAAGTCSIADRIAALLTAVVAHRRLGQLTDAAELLAEALALAEPDDASGPFVAAGAQVRSALTVLLSPSSRCAGFASRILDRFDGRLPRPASAQPAALLTDSELAVLRFLPSHMTNQEIAESLFLSINTIKTHLSSVYRKLGVVNRRQAIAQGRRLELLLRPAGRLRHRRLAISPARHLGWSVSQPLASITRTHTL